MTTESVTPQTRLTECTWNGDIPGIDSALADGAKMEYMDIGGTALMRTIIYNKLEAAEHLIKLGAAINAVRITDGYTPLIIATSEENAKMVRLLIANGADVTARTPQGLGLGHILAQDGGSPNEIWNILLEPATRLPECERPDHARSGDMVLLALGSVLTRYSHGAPASLLALMRRGADMTVTTKKGESVLHALVAGSIPEPDCEENPWSRFIRVTAVISNLLEAGLSPLLPDAAGVTAYETVQTIPVLIPLFRKQCAALEERMQHFDPALDPLLDGADKPTDLVLYACTEGRLGEILALDRWSKPRELVDAKNRLRQALPPYYNEKCSADLDASAVQRGQVSPLAAHLRHSATKNGRGGKVV